MRTKNRKNKVKRIRKTTKYAYITISIVLIVISFISLINSFTNQNLATKTEEIYTYKNKFNCDYDVSLIENEYIKGLDKADKNIAYVTDLIDYTNLSLNYQYKADTDSELTYDYEIIGKTEATYTRNGEKQKIIQEEEILKEKITNNVKSNSVNINENVVLDLKEKNRSINEFKQKFGMAVEATYTVMLRVNVATNIENKKVDNSYNSIVTIDLGDKTTKIDGENNKENTGYISKQYVEENISALIIVIDFVMIIIAIYLLRIVAKAKITNRVTNEFRKELNKIIKLCQDKIVEINTKPEDEDKNIVYVKDFGEILKLSEELFTPILYYLDMENQEAYFSVIHDQSLYRYILKG